MIIDLPKAMRVFIIFFRGAIGETVNTFGCEPNMNGFDSRIAPHT